MTEKEKQELAELEELDALEAKYSSTPVASEPSVPSVDEIEEPMQSSTALEAAGTGALQGATFGFSDELGAMKDTGIDALKGKVALNDLYSRYREAQKAREAANELQREEHPYAYTGGELAGGIGSALAVPLPGLGLAGVAARVGKMGEGATALARIGAKGAQGAIEGIVPGALYGAGSSEKTIEQPKELAEDVGSSAAMGSLGGLVLGTGIKSAGEAKDWALGKASNAIDNSAFLSKLRESFKLGQEGIDYGNRIQSEQLSQLPNVEAKALVDKFSQAKDELGKAASNALEVAQSQGVNINIDPSIRQAAAQIEAHISQNPVLIQSLDNASLAILKKIGSQAEGSFTPLEAKALGDRLQYMLDSLSGVNTEGANITRRLALDFRRSLGNSLKESIPEYKIAAENYKSLMENVHETVLNQGAPKEYRDVRYGDLSNAKSKLFDETKKMLEFGEKSGVSHKEQLATFKQLKDNLTSLQQSNPEVLNTITKGEDLGSFLKTLQDKMSRLQSIREAKGVDPTQGVGKFSLGGVRGVAITAPGIAHGGANLAGLATRVLNNPSKVSNIANKLKSSEATRLLGEKLEESLANKDDFGRNAVMFQLLQNPNYRNMLKDEEELSDE